MSTPLSRMMSWLLAFSGPSPMLGSSAWGKVFWKAVLFGKLESLFWKAFFWNAGKPFFGKLESLFFGMLESLSLKSWKAFPLKAGKPYFGKLESLSLESWKAFFLKLESFSESYTYSWALAVFSLA